VLTLQDALVAYRTYARAEGKSPKTVDWVVSSVGYLAEFLSPEQQGIEKITGDDLRRFIIALRDKPKFANHLYNTTQQAKLSAQSIETYCRGIRAFFGFLKRESFVENNVMAKVKMPKVPEEVIPTFTKKESEKLLTQPDKSSDEGFRDYCSLLTFIDTGIRLSELAGLKTDDIDYEQNLFRAMGKGQRVLSISDNGTRLTPFYIEVSLLPLRSLCHPSGVYGYFGHFCVPLSLTFYIYASKTFLKLLSYGYTRYRGC